MSLTNFVDQMDSTFPSLSDFNVTALKWTDFDQDVVYQIASTRTVTTQHGPSVILSLQKADGSSYSAWACGMLSKELLQNPMIMVSSRLFVLLTGKKTSIVIYLSNISETEILVFFLSRVWLTVLPLRIHLEMEL